MAEETVEALAAAAAEEQLKLEEQIRKQVEETLAQQAKYEAEQLKRALNAAKEAYKEDVLVNTDNISSLVFNSAKISVEDANVKALELTSLLNALLRPGIYDSIASAQKDLIPPGTFIIVDDPNTDEKEFTVAIVPFYYVEEVVEENADLVAEDPTN
jgi:hypothetical protein